MKKYLFVSLLVLMFTMAVSASVASAQTVEVEATVTAEGSTAEAIADSSISTETVLEGMDIVEPAKAPSGARLFFRGIRERVTIAFTIDPVKKAEKELQFAEERIKIAEKIVAGSVDEAAQARAEKVIVRASELMAAVEARKEKLLENPDARAQRLLKNIATHEERKEVALDRISDRLPEDKKAAFEEKREKMEQEGKRFLNTLVSSTDKIPEDVKMHLENVKARIEASAEVKKDFRMEQKVLLEKSAAGDGAAKEDLKKLNEERKTQLQDIRQEFRGAPSVKGGGVQGTPNDGSTVEGGGVPGSPKRGAGIEGAGVPGQPNKNNMPAMKPKPGKEAVKPANPGVRAIQGAKKIEMDAKVRQQEFQKELDQ